MNRRPLDSVRFRQRPPGSCEFGKLGMTCFLCDVFLTEGYDHRKYLLGTTDFFSYLYKRTFFSCPTSSDECGTALHLEQARYLHMALSCNASNGLELTLFSFEIEGGIPKQNTKEQHFSPA